MRGRIACTSTAYTHLQVALFLALAEGAQILIVTDLISHTTTMSSSGGAITLMCLQGHKARASEPYL